MQYKITYENETGASDPLKAVLNIVEHLSGFGGEGRCFTVEEMGTGRTFTVDLNDEGNEVVEEKSNSIVYPGQEDPTKNEGRHFRK